MMAWTYTASPGTDTEAGRRDAVRLAVGDTDTNDQQLQDAEILYFLSESDNNINGAAALAARAIAGKYSRLADVSFDPVRTSYSQISKSYLDLAVRLEREAKKSGSLGAPAAGGISIAEIDAADEDSDRPTPAFRRNQFRNPPDHDEDKEWVS